MRSSLASVQFRFAQLLFALAALFCALGPGLDSVAKAMPAGPKGSPIEQFVRSFDVIDDVLDHVAGKPHVCQQHQLQLPHALPDETAACSPLTSAAAAWRTTSGPLPKSHFLETQTPPPRA
jgi:hypothetical protein